MANTKKIIQYDFFLLIITVALTVCGILFIYSSGVDTNGNINNNEYIRQIIWAALGIGMLILFSLLDYRIFRSVSFYSYLISMLVLLFVLLFGREVNGARSWIGIGSLGIQPSEMAKLTTIMYLAYYLERNVERIHSVKILSRAGIITAIPFLLILLQPDLGTAMVYLPVFLIMAFVAGSKTYHLLFLFFAGVIALIMLIIPEWLHARALYYQQPIPIIAINKLIIWLMCGGAFTIVVIAYIGWKVLGIQYFYWIAYINSIICCALISSLLLRSVLQGYQMKRLIIFIDPFLDPRGSGWNVIQSLNAVGSGGLLGKGFLQGIHSHSNYLPQQSTDFIFSILSEEWGFIGGGIIFILFLTLILKGIAIAAETAESNLFGVLIGTGIVTIICVHFSVNVGMAMGIMPITGIPLLFLSHGGSALISIMTMVGILISLRLYQQKFG